MNRQNSKLYSPDPVLSLEQPQTNNKNLNPLRELETAIVGTDQDYLLDTIITNIEIINSIRGGGSMRKRQLLQATIRLKALREDTNSSIYFSYETEPHKLHYTLEEAKEEIMRVTDQTRVDMLAFYDNNEVKDWYCSCKNINKEINAEDEFHIYYLDSSENDYLYYLSQQPQYADAIVYEYKCHIEDYYYEALYRRQELFNKNEMYY